ncbi:bile acid:sodium symporter family protein [Paenibacillus sp. GP183]|uniref:bile acid:sodium symporter family protein n=1 Tax=Paenibacillus sp. GP183 TaxID=1882751 RepID=UPI000B8A5A98|nr:bile acid:sodium symporter family protein [Paenibacillus sp. GP183]
MRGTMLIRLNKGLEKVMPLLTPTGVLIGVVGTYWLNSYAGFVPWIFAVMTFSGSLGSSFKDLVKVMTHPKPIICLFVILHIVMPFVGWTAGHVLFPNDLYTETGYILLFVIPTGVVSVVWVSIYKGNIPLTLSLILLDTLLSPLIVPASLNLWVGAKVQMDVWAIMKGLLWMVVIPSLIGMALNQMTKGRIKKTWGATLAPFSKIGLFVVVAINSSLVAPYLKQFNGKLMMIIIVTLVTTMMGYLAGWAISRWFRWDRDFTVTAIFNSGMRNLSAGAVLAVQYFPAPVALPVISGILFQQILAALFGYLLGKRQLVEGKIK